MRESSNVMSMCDSLLSLDHPASWSSFAMDQASQHFIRNSWKKNVRNDKRRVQSLKLH